MDFDPLSDNEEDVTFMPERKKKDKEEKRRKSKGSHKLDKKEKVSFNDGSTPTTMKTKSVHGVVGPAEYIQESSPTHAEPINNQAATSPSNHATSQNTANQVFSQQQVTPQKLQQQPSQQSAIPQPQSATPQPQWTPQQQNFAKQQQHSNSTPNFQQIQFQATPNNVNTSAQFSTSFNTSLAKIERPHSSAALLQERTPHSPAPFKQPSAQHQKMTLLAQANQTQLQSTPPVQQNSTLQSVPSNQQLAAATAAANLTHHRNSSYSRAMSLPVVTANNQDPAATTNQDHFRFNAFDKSPLEVNTNNLAGSPIIENPASPFQRSNSLTTPPLTPNNKYSSSQELWNNAPPINQSQHHHHHSNHRHSNPNVDKTGQQPQLPTAGPGQEPLDGDWAQFSPQGVAPSDEDLTSSATVPEQPSEIVGHVKSNRIDIPMRRRSQTESMASSSMASSLPESTSSVDSEVDQDEWKITEEQREYYTNQFANLQPNLEDVIKGPQARDFFMKSNLPMEILSGIWQLSDVDKDGALSLYEFRIAMHLVVLIKHGYDLPAVLPPILLGQDHVELANEDVEGLSDEDVSKLINDDDTKQDSGDWSAEFDGTDGVPRDANERVQTYGQPSPTSVTVPLEARVHPVSSDGVDITAPTQDNSQRDNRPADVAAAVNAAPFIHGTPQKDNPLLHPPDENDPPSSPLSYPGEKKEGIASIARPRATANKNVNLMDASPWQLLPPPSGKMVGGKPFPNAKKSLEMGSTESGIDDESSGTAGDTNNKLVAIDHHHQGSEPTMTNDDPSASTTTNKDFQRQRSPTADSSMDNIDDDEDDDVGVHRLKVNKKRSDASLGGGYFRNFSKEKSRSIDSLRSDISESSMFEWKRQSIRRESRPRSFTGESTHGEGVTPQYESPPVPPPRVNKGHQRASSLDFNQMFSNRSPRVASEPRLESATTPTDGSRINPPQKPPRSNPPNQPAATAGSAGHATNDDYRRSRSLDITLDESALNDKPHIRIKSLDSPFDENARSNSKEHVRFAEEPEVLSNSSKSPLEIQMRKHELQSRLRDLKTKNSTLLSLISQLGMEWKEACAERISLEIRLQRAEQELE